MDTTHKNIESIDKEIIDLIDTRIDLIKNLIKKDCDYFTIQNQQLLLEKIKSFKQKNLKEQHIETLFSEIFSISREFHKKEEVGFLGPSGSYTHQAAKEIFGSTNSFISLLSIKGIFREVANKNLKYGVVPIENSSNGMVSDTISCFNEYNVNIVAEVVIDIHHTLATNCKKVEEIKRIYSKDIAFDQCKIFLDNLGLNEVEHIFVDSTTTAAKIASKEQGSAAISPLMGANLNKLPVLFHNIEDNPNNRTRFFVISDYNNPIGDNDKTTIIAQLPNTPGTLVEFLTDFNSIGINLTKIKSHIVNGVSIFFIDFSGHYQEKHVAKLLEKHKEQVKVLGSYKKMVEDI